jgi:hypothetical protein
MSVNTDNLIFSDSEGMQLFNSEEYDSSFSDILKLNNPLKVFLFLVFLRLEKLVLYRKKLEEWEKIKSAIGKFRKG